VLCMRDAIAAVSLAVEPLDALWQGRLLNLEMPGPTYRFSQLAMFLRGLYSACTSEVVAFSFSRSGAVLLCIEDRDKYEEQVSDLRRLMLRDLEVTVRLHFICAKSNYAAPIV